MASQFPYDVGSDLASKASIFGQASAAAATINGAWIDLDSLTTTGGGAAGRPGSAKVGIHCGALTGAPTTVAVTVKIQDALDTSGTGAADFKPDGVNTAQSTTGAVATNTDSNFNLNLRGSRRCIRQVMTVAFTGGTAPTAQVSGEFTFGGFPNTPVVTPAA